MKRLGTSTIQKPKSAWTEEEIEAAADEIKSAARKAAQEWGYPIDEGSWVVTVEPLLGGQVIRHHGLGANVSTMTTPTMWGVVVRWTEDWS